MLSVVENRDTFFKETSNRYKQLLEEFYNSNIKIMEFPWGLAPIYDILGIVENAIPNFKPIFDNIGSVEDYTILSMGISIIEPGNTPALHYDSHPSDGRFKRYHLPLQLTDSSELIIQENSEWKKYSWELGKWMEFSGLSHLHYPTNNDKNGISRIVLLMDVIEGECFNKDVWEYYEETERLGARIKGVDFRPYFERYIQNKTLLS